MASILDRYGIKEVADVTFYKLDDNGQPQEPVLYLDTLKVSTIEQTAESVDARGGKGNPKLVTWDYGKEITVTLEDALFSAKSMSISLGNGSVDMATDSVERTVMVRATDSSLPDFFIADVPLGSQATDGAERKRVWCANASDMPSGNQYVALASSGLHILGIYSETGVDCGTSWETAVTPGNKYFVKYYVAAIKKTITISGDKFPGTYYVTGDTYARSDVNGKDQFFQFIIPKAKLQAEQTITLEAEGDPSVFNMNLTVLRPEDGEMMKLVQYDITK